STAPRAAPLLRSSGPAMRAGGTKQPIEGSATCGPEREVPRRSAAGADEPEKAESACALGAAVGALEAPVETGVEAGAAAGPVACVLRISMFVRPRCS